jgi:hypothetical protein
MVQNCRFTVSVRGKPPYSNIMGFLSRYYPSIKTKDIDSVFGFLEPCSLYGGRPFLQRQISDADITALYKHDIALRIPLTNHFADKATYDKNRGFLEKYHRPQNALIIANDSLVPWIRKDFPEYQIEASLIKNLKTIAQIDSALKIYETVVLPMELCENYEFLEKIPDKSRITLFANAGCALTCPARICYRAISRINRLTGSSRWYVRLAGYPYFVLKVQCSQNRLYRKQRGNISFNLDKLVELGFHRFKVLRPRAHGKSCY